MLANSDHFLMQIVRNCTHNNAGFSESNEGENDRQRLRSRDNLALPCKELNLRLGKPTLSVALFPPMEQSFNPVLACKLNFQLSKSGSKIMQNMLFSAHLKNKVGASKSH